jgi:hypothetical protein
MEHEIIIGIKPNWGIYIYFMWVGCPTFGYPKLSSKCGVTCMLLVPA